MNNQLVENEDRLFYWPSTSDLPERTSNGHWMVSVPFFDLSGAIRQRFNAVKEFTFDEPWKASGSDIDNSPPSFSAFDEYLLNVPEYNDYVKLAITGVEFFRETAKAKKDLIHISVFCEKRNEQYESQAISSFTLNNKIGISPYYYVAATFADKEVELWGNLNAPLDPIKIVKGGKVVGIIMPMRI